MQKHWHAPLLEHLIQFSQQKPLSLHVPGHRHGEVYGQLTEQLRHTDYEELMRYMAKLGAIDVTELSHTDDLHDPETIIKDAQAATAKLYGAERSFFLVGGSTAGNIALILSLCDTNDYIIVQRNVHKSIINSCKLAGANVIFLNPAHEATTNLPVIPSIDTVQQALVQYPQAKAVFLTNPNYYGISADLSEYVTLVHNYHMPLLVDEAHGAHYGIAPYAPPSALKAGADAVVQSMHKTLPAFTMGAVLHTQGQYILKTRLQQQLSIIQSSSPSYVIMASLDAARATLECYGYEWFLQTYTIVNRLTEWLHSKQLCLRVEQLDSKSLEYKQDPYRMLLFDQSNKVTGYQLQKMLEAKMVWAEMANEKYVVLVWHMNATEQQYEIVQRALLEIHQQISVMVASCHTVSTIINAPEVMISNPVKLQRFPSNRKIETIALIEAKGRHSAEMVIPYPPGIPILFEEEVVQAFHIENLLQFIHSGARFQGSTTISEGMIKVFI